MKKTFALLLMLVLALGISVHAATLPAEYTELAYVSAEGNSYFDTGLYATAATKIEAKFSYDKDGCYLYGASDTQSSSNTLSSCLKSEVSANWRLMNGVVGLMFAHDTVYETVHDASGVTVNGTLNAFATTPSATQKTPHTFAIGSCMNASGNPNVSSWKFSGDIYYIKISENGTLIRSFVPCLRVSDGVAGLYDTVEGEFYVSEGSSDFLQPNAKAEVTINADAGIVRNAVTGEIYFAKEPHLEHAMASTTKIMTALLSVEHLDLDSRTLPAIASDQVGDGNTRINLELGEELTVRDALYGLMLPSGNDAANLLGRTVAGSYEAFAEMMNAKAAELGLKQTCFTTPSGTDAPGHYTTAADYSVVANEAMSYEAFRTIVGTSHYTIEAEPEYNVVRRELANTNYLLPGLELDGKVYTYEGAVGVKTGTTGDAGACLVSAAKRNGTDLIAVVLGAPGNTSATNRFTESIKLLDHGFETAADQPYTVTVDGNKLTAVNPDTGYTMVATITASDAALIGASVEPAIVTTTYPEGINWNTDWDITYTNNDKLGTATASISFGGKTASCEFEVVEPTVTLTESAKLDSLIVPAGQTYDLNGYALTVENGLVVNEGGKIMGGMLHVGKSAIVNMGDNGGWIPVWTGEAGNYDIYELYAAEIKAGKTVISTNEGTKYSFGYKLTENTHAFSPYVGAVDAGEKIKFGVQLSLDGAKATYNFSPESVAKMEGINAAASSGDFFKVNLKLAGGNNDLTKVRVAPVIKVKDLGFEYVGETTGEGSGEYVARINTTGYYTLEDAIAAVTELGTVTDVKLVGDIEFKRPVTIELNGKTRFITLSRSNIEISGPVTFDGMSDEGAESDTVLFRVYGASALTLKDGVVIRDINNTRTTDDNRMYGAVARVESGTFSMDGVTVENCSSPNRGVVYSNNAASVVNIRNSTFTGNTARKNFGGAIAINTGKSVNVENSVFTENKAATHGGAVGVYNGDVTVTLKNNTFTDNACGATSRGGAIGLHNDAIGKLTVDGGQFSGNTVDDIGKGGGEVTLEGEIVGLDAITLSANEYIIVGETLALDEAASVTVNGNVTVSGSEINGGQYITEDGVRTVIPNYIAAVGDARYETLTAAILATEDATAATVIELYGDETVSAASTVTLNPNVQIKVTADSVISGPLTIDGANEAHTAAVPIVVDGCKLTLKDGATLKDISSTFAEADDYHGILRIQNGGELELNKATVTGCTAPCGVLGGRNYPVITLIDATLSNNESTGSGGTIFAYGAKVTATGTVFEGNISGKNGGAIHVGNSSSKLTMTDCKFIENTSKEAGGAISINSGATGNTFTNCVFTGNKSGTQGGAARISGSEASVIFTECKFTDNIAQTQGGAVRISGEKSSVIFNGVTMRGNKASSTNANAISYTAGSISLAGKIDIDYIAMSNKLIFTLDAPAEFVNNVTVSGPKANVATFTGSMVGEYYKYFTHQTATLTFDSTGKCVSK